MRFTTRGLTAFVSCILLATTVAATAAAYVSSKPAKTCKGKARKQCTSDEKAVASHPIDVGIQDGDQEEQDQGGSDVEDLSADGYSSDCSSRSTASTNSGSCASTPSSQKKKKAAFKDVLKNPSTSTWLANLMIKSGAVVPPAKKRNYPKWTLPETRYFTYESSTKMVILENCSVYMDKRTYQTHEASLREMIEAYRASRSVYRDPLYWFGVDNAKVV